MKVKEIADFLKGNFIGNGETEILRIASPEKAQEGDISFIGKAVISDDFAQINASCLIVSPKFLQKLSCPLIKVENPKLAFAKLSKILHPDKIRKPEIHRSAVISENAKVDRGVFIGAFCCVGEGSEIGKGTQILDGAKVGNNAKVGENCVLHANVLVGDDCRIGDNVVLHAGVIIGADGFGFVRDENEYVKFPQVGTVVIENDVEIGANSCVDRGALGQTRIGRGTKIDNLVQVAHNVDIGERVVIAAQTGISGSVTIEDDCTIAGQVGIADHATIKKGNVIGAKSGVFSGKILRKGFWGGIPVRPLADYKRQTANIKLVPKIKEEIKKLQKIIKGLEK